jgi:hypothetical protein
MRMRHHTARLLAAILAFTLSGCFQFGSKDSDRKAADAAIRGEVAEIVKLYRLCLQKNEETPAKARDNCGVYKDAIKDLAPEGQKSIVADLLDRLSDKDR